MVAIHEVAERAALERSMATLNPAVLLLDLALPHLGIEGVPTIQRLSPSTQIVLFSSSPDEKEAISALKAGARGYHSRDIAPYLLRKAVQLVRKGEIWVGRNVIPHLLKELTSLTERRKPDAPAGPDGRLDRLTPREREITHLIGNGASNKEIASQLEVTEKTVKAHLTAIFRKLGLSDRLRLALFVSEHSRMSR
jgi:DNA-binding NarL/FixJ family response regulator